MSKEFEDVVGTLSYESFKERYFNSKIDKQLYADLLNMHGITKEEADKDFDDIFRIEYEDYLKRIEDNVGHTTHKS